MQNLRVTISQNLQTLIASQRDRGGRLTNSRAISQAAGVSKSTVQRLIWPREGETWPVLDKVECVARAFGLALYQLLTPDLDPDNPPLLMDDATRRELRRLRLMEQQLQQLATPPANEEQESDAPAADGRHRGEHPSIEPNPSRGGGRRRALSPDND